MQNVVTAIFNVESEAYQAFAQLRRKPAGENYVAAEFALIKREGDAIKVEDACDAAAITADDTALGMAAGAVAGILGGPLGVLLGAYTGTVAGAAFDAADSVDSMALLEATAAKLMDGDVAIIALVEEEEPAFDAALEGFDVQIVRHFAIDVMNDVDRALEEAAQDANLAKQEERAARKASVKEYFATLKQQYEDNKAKREAKREAHLDELADKANELNAKLAEADKAAGEKIKEMAAEHEAFDKAMDEAVADANAAFVSETKDIMGE